MEISIDNGYGATCWEVHLGWRQGGKDMDVYAYEAQFIKDSSPPPNVVFMNWDDYNDDWPGLGPTIIAAVKKAGELGALIIQKN